MSDTEYDRWGNSNLLSQVGADILNLLFLHDFFHIFPCIVYAKTNLLLLFKSMLSERLSRIQWESDVLVFWEFMNIVSILFYNFTEFIILLYTFLVISFASCKYYII